MIFLLLSMSSFSQSYRYAHFCLDTLTSNFMSGRGYQDSGDKKAATFIANELKYDGAKPIGDTFFQSFDISINNINSVTLQIEKDTLKTGEDFLVFGSSPSCDLLIENEKFIAVNSDITLKKVKNEKLNNKIIIIKQNEKKLKKGKYLEQRDIFMFLQRLCIKKIIPKLVIIQGYDNKLQYPISTVQWNFPVLMLKENRFSKKIERLYLSIEANYIEKYQTQNVWAKVEGTKCKDSFFVFTAHYDHLGRCGNAIFKGAADNASGTSVVMDLARYFSQHPAEYSILFIFFSGEEIGLLGSEYAATHPLIDLNKIKFLFNLDMCGTGSGGVAVINGQKENKAGELLKAINDEHLYFKTINLAEESCNSDHCPFVKRGVAAHFLFTYGCEYNEYHTVYDNGDGLSFTKHIDFCNLLKEFVEKYR
jgi:hypothetical protein